MPDHYTARIAEHLRELRQQKGWSLDHLAKLSGVSRATLSRLEKAEVSPTTEVLAKLCAAHDLTISRLLLMVEEAFSPLVRRYEQAVWSDVRTGFARRSVSPPSGPLAGEVLECELTAGATLTYETSPSPGLEHHLVMLDGDLMVEVEGREFHLQAGDCLRYQLYGGTRFEAGAKGGARYIMVLV